MINIKLFELLKKDLEEYEIDTNQSLVQLVKIHRSIFYIDKVKMFPYPTLKEAEKYVRDYFKFTQIKEKKVKKKYKKPNYYVYIKSKAWMELTAKFKVFKNNRCEKCCHKSNLNVHHLHYKTLGRERFSDLMLLCVDCHRKEHGIGNSEEDIMRFIMTFS